MKNDSKEIRADQNEALVKIRDRIDEIDLDILNLLKERLGCAQKIGKLKSEDNIAKWDPLRERQIFDRLISENQDVFPDQSLNAILFMIILL